MNIEPIFEDTSDVEILLLENIGIINGTSNGKFEPSRNISRQEATVMLNKLSQLMNLEKNTDTADYSDDNDIALWAKDSVYSVSSIKIKDNIYVMSRIGNNIFSPNFPYTIEQAIATMYRIFEYSSQI